MEEQNFYNAYSYEDQLSPGKTFKLVHSISFREEKADLSSLVTRPLADLLKQKADSSDQEKEIFAKLRSAVSEWEKQAAQTLLLEKAIEYVQTPAVKHTGNQWQKSEYGWQEISNMVYKMSYRIREDTTYDRKLQKSVPVAWYVSWSLSYNVPNRKGYYRTSSENIAGQDQKRYTDQAAAEKYVNGRIAAYSHLFVELSPPVPADSERLFTMNGHLLPGYSVQAPEPTAQDLLAFLEDNDFGSVDTVSPALTEKKPEPQAKSPAKKRSSGPCR